MEPVPFGGSKVNWRDPFASLSVRVIPLPLGLLVTVTFSMGITTTLDLVLVFLEPLATSCLYSASAAASYSLVSKARSSWL